MAIHDQRRDDDHLTLLSAAYYVVSALVVVFSLFPLAYLGLAIWVVRHPDVFGPQGAGPGRVAASALIAIASAWVVVAWGLVLWLLLLGRSLARRRRYVFCLVTAVLCVPLGTILGILTIVVLMRPSVKEAFGRPAGPAPVVSL
jgi:hypothetical protein